MATCICTGPVMRLSVPDAGGQHVETEVKPFVALTSSDRLLVGIQRVRDNAAWSYGEALVARKAEDARTQLLQAWRAMKLLERVPACFLSDDLRVVWYCARADVLSADMYSALFLEEYFETSAEAVKVRQQILSLTPDAEEFRAMSAALEEGIAKNERAWEDPCAAREMVATRPDDTVACPSAKHGKMWRQVKVLLGQLLPRG